MKAFSDVSSEVSLKVKLTKADGTEQEVQADSVQIDPEALIAEYRRAALYLETLEHLMKQIPEISKRMK